MAPLQKLVTFVVKNIHVSQFFCQIIYRTGRKSKKFGGFFCRRRFCIYGYQTRRTFSYQDLISVFVMNLWHKKLHPLLWMKIYCQCQHFQSVFNLSFTYFKVCLQSKMWVLQWTLLNSQVLNCKTKRNLLFYKSYRIS